MNQPTFVIDYLNQRNNNNSLHFLTLLISCVILLFILPLVSSSSGDVFQIENACVTTNPIVWEKNHNGGFSLKSNAIYNILNPCKSSQQKYVMMPLDLISSNDMKRNILIFDKTSNQLIRYDPVNFSSYSSIFQEKELDKILKKETAQLGIVYNKESFSGIPLSDVSLNLYDIVKYSSPGRTREKIYDSVFQEGVNYIDTLPMDIFKKAYDFLDQDLDVNLALRENDPEDIEEFKNTISFMDDLLLDAPKLKKDITLVKGIRLMGHLNPWKELSVGNVIFDPTYQFVTSDQTIAKNYGDIFLHINVPAGTPILAWEYLSDNPSFHELILPRNGRYHIVKKQGNVVYVNFIYETATTTSHDEL